eukprot:1211016-Rhodomonas_salina.1
MPATRLPYAATSTSSRSAYCDSYGGRAVLGVVRCCSSLSAVSSALSALSASLSSWRCGVLRQLRGPCGVMRSTEAA